VYEFFAIDWFNHMALNAILTDSRFIHYFVVTGTEDNRQAMYGNYQLPNQRIRY